MSRNLTAAAQAQATAQHYTMLVMVKFEFGGSPSTSVFVHSGVGTVTYNGDNYIGVGSFGAISEVRESQRTKPGAIELQLDALNTVYLAEALNAGAYGDPVTIYAGYRASDGSLVADPWTLWTGWFEFASISAGTDNMISVTAQHDLSVLDERDNSRFTDEDQQRKYSGDLGFQYVHEAATAKIVWGGGNPFLRGGSTGGPGSGAAYKV